MYFMAMISSSLARHRSNGGILLVFEREKWCILARHSPPTLTPTPATWRGSEQNPGVLVASWWNVPQHTPTPHLRGDREKINWKGSGRTAFDLPPALPIPIGVPHATSCRLLPPFLPASAGNRKASCPLPQQPCWFLLQRLLFWESAEFSIAARCSQRSPSVLSWPFGAGLRARAALSAVAPPTQGHRVQPPTIRQTQGCQGRWHRNCGQGTQSCPRGTA